VRCRTCGLVRSDPVAEKHLLDSLYAKSSFNYGAEVENLRHTYGRYLERARRHVARAGSLLEVGCGNGFFLEEAHQRGVAEVWGVEPSCAAVAAAPAWLRPRIRCEVMRPGLFSSESFEYVCLFQVFDHFPDPAELVAECFRLLRPGGVVLALNHNISAVTARLLGEMSPIVDIEHTFLYSPATMTRIFSGVGFEVVEAGAAWNSLSLFHLIRLLPLTARPKQVALSLLKRLGVDRWTLRVPLGNLYQIARKPTRPATHQAASVASAA
jgi:SAM-dependent methyltransferase